MTDPQDGSTKKAVLGGGGIVLENRESAEAVHNSIKSTILNSSKHLDGITEVAEALYPEYKLKLKSRASMTLVKLLGGHVVTDSCTSAQATNYGLVDDIIDAARVSWEAKKVEQDNMKEANNDCLPDNNPDLIPLQAYTVLYWHHLHNVWFKGIDEELSKYLQEQFKEQLNIIDEGMVEAGLGNYDIEGSTDKADQTNDTDRVDASMKNVARAVEKLFCPKGTYEKDDQMNFAQFMLKYYPDALLVHLERACSGARHDICCEAALAILLNRPYYLKYLQSRILWHRDKKKNKLICALYAILLSRQMTACLRVMCVFDVAIVK